jgi:hypothetical protein
MKVVYPFFVRSLADETDTRHGLSKGRREVWVLYIIGPFCLLRSGSDRFSKLADSVSNLLGITTVSRPQEGALHIQVLLDEETEEHLRQIAYRKAIRRANPKP